MTPNSSTVWSRAKRSFFNLGPNKRLLLVLCAVSVIGGVYVSANSHVSARLEIAQGFFDRARQLNNQLLFNTSSISDNKQIGKVLAQAIHKDRTLADIRSFERSRQRQERWQCGDAEWKLSGPVEPLLRLMTSLQARGIALMSLRWARSDELKLEVCL
ncbi:hypothetical protein V8U11_06135 [Pseudomonas chlororaphis]|uniref:hypothetical protein n=1 Tax=Pseudomonas chlororaphis TaxID=587753 RepID=UPI0030CE3F3F